MDKSDIEEDVKTGNLTGIENAFRALVNWPYEDTIKGVETVEGAMDLLEGVATSLAWFSDTRAMPGDIVEVLRQERRGRGAQLSGSTYKAGANLVLEHIEWWRALFARTLPGKA